MLTKTNPVLTITGLVPKAQYVVLELGVVINRHQQVLPVTKREGPLQKARVEEEMLPAGEAKKHCRESWESVPHTSGRWSGTDTKVVLGRSGSPAAAGRSWPL